VLGEGGYGKAYLVKSRENSKSYVMKEVRLSALKQQERDDALREAKVLSSLRFPYIVQYVESFQERGNFYIVMDFADGGDLAKKIQRRGKNLFPESEILHDFIQLSLAIKYIHDRKILHRDLKADNVFLMSDGTIKLGDFGIARVLERTFQLCRTQIGTPYYLSPEICEGKLYNSKTDIWSLGCILYELCTLKHPFDAPNMNGLLASIIRGKYQPISSSYSKELKTLLTRMLSKEPASRPSVNQILGMPFIKAKLSSYLDEQQLKYEMSHTILHGRKPFQAPTVLLSEEKPSKPGTARDKTRPLPKDDARAKEIAALKQQAENREREKQAAADKKRADEIAALKQQAENREREKQAAADKKRADEIAALKQQAENRERETQAAADKKRADDAERKRILDQDALAAAEKKRVEEAEKKRVLAEKERAAEAERKRLLDEEKAEKRRADDIERKRVMAEKQERERAAEAERKRVADENRAAVAADAARRREEEAQKAREDEERRQRRQADFDRKKEADRRKMLRDLEEQRKRRLAERDQIIEQGDGEEDPLFPPAQVDVVLPSGEPNDNNNPLYDSISGLPVPSWALNKQVIIAVDDEEDEPFVLEELSVPPTPRRGPPRRPQTAEELQREDFFKRRREAESNRRKVQGDPVSPARRDESPRSVHRQQRASAQDSLRRVESDPGPSDDEIVQEPSEEDREAGAELARFLREALDLPEAGEDDAGEAGFEVPEDEELTYQIGDRVIKFPVCEDDQGARAEAMRAFLDREITHEKLIRLNEEIRGEYAFEVQDTPISDSLDPAIVQIARQLYVLDHEHDDFGS
jgi:NIMA (never in mitosis gene a)-related kinase